MHHREMTSITGGVEGGGRLGDVLANDRHLADVAIAEPELVVSQADRPRIVRAFSLPERLGKKGAPARVCAAGPRQASVHPPQVRKTGRIKPLSPFGRLPKRL